MKKAEKYVDGWTFHGKITKQTLINLVKQVQEDAIKETVKMCAENAKTKPVNSGHSLIWSPDNLDKQSILSVADNLIAEI